MTTHSPHAFLASPVYPASIFVALITLKNPALSSLLSTDFIWFRMSVYGYCGRAISPRDK